MSLSDVKQTIVQTFMEGLQQPSEAWREGFDFVTTDAPSVKLASYSGIGAIPVWDGVSDLDTADINDRFTNTITYTEYGLQLRVPKRAAKDVPGLLENGARKLGVAVSNTYGTIGATILADVFASTTSAGDGVALVSSSHTLASGGTRDNRLDSAFDRSGFLGAINLAMLWTSYHGQEEDFSQDPFVFYGSPADTTLLETVGEVFGSTVSSDQMQVNVAKGFNVTPVIWPKLTVSTRSVLMSKNRKPLVYWIRDSAASGTTIDEDNLSYKINVDFAIGTKAKPDPAGIIGFYTA